MKGIGLLRIPCVLALLGEIGCSRAPLTCEIRGQHMASDRKTSSVLRPGDTLVSGDYFSFSIRMSQPSHVYAVQFSPGGRGRVLYPSSQTRMHAQETRLLHDVRIPWEEDLWFRLDDVPGEEHVYIVVSAKELSQADREVANALEEVHISTRASNGSPSLEGGPPSPAPPATTYAHGVGNPKARAQRSGGTDPHLEGAYEHFKAKGVELVSIDDGAGYGRCVERGGLAVMRFLIHHVAPDASGTTGTRPRVADETREASGGDGK